MGKGDNTSQRVPSISSLSSRYVEFVSGDQFFAVWPSPSAPHRARTWNILSEELICFNRGLQMFAVVGPRKSRQPKALSVVMTNSTIAVSDCTHSAVLSTTQTPKSTHDTVRPHRSPEHLCSSWNSDTFTGLSHHTAQKFRSTCDPGNQFSHRNLPTARGPVNNQTLAREFLNADVAKNFIVCSQNKTRVVPRGSRSVQHQNSEWRETSRERIMFTCSNKTRCTSSISARKHAAFSW